MNFSCAHKLACIRHVCQAVSIEALGDAELQGWRVRDSEWAHRAGSLGETSKRNPDTTKVCGGRSELEQGHREARRCAVRTILAVLPRRTGSPSAAGRPAASAPGVATRIGSLPWPTLRLMATNREIESRKKGACPLNNFGASPVRYSRFY